MSTIVLNRSASPSINAEKTLSLAAWRLDGVARTDGGDFP
jgi:hypothetical protein